MSKKEILEEKTPVLEGSEIPEPPKPEPLPSPELELASLQEQLAKAQKEVEETRTLAKKHEQAATRNANKLQQQQELQNLLAAQKEEMGVIRDAVMELIDREEGSLIEPPPTRRSERYLSRLKTAEPKPPAPEANPEFLELAQEADSLVKSVGLTMGQSEELDKALWLFNVGQPQRGLDEVKKVVESKKTAVPTTKAQLTEADEEEIARKVAERRGRLVSDTGLLSSASRSFAQIEQDYIEGKISYGEYAEARKKYKI